MSANPIFRCRGRWMARALCVLALAGIASAASFRQNRPNAFFWRPDLAPNGPVVLVVSLDEQRLYAYRNGVAIGASPISSGKPGYATPTGIYTILEKARVHHSNLYDDAPMPFMLRITWDGVALHAGALPGHPASHGCIRLPAAFAERLFEATGQGTVVVVADARVAPAVVAHPAAIAPIDLQGNLTDLAGVARPLPDAIPAPLSIVVSTHDRALYVLGAGHLVATSPLETRGEPVRGTLLYVRRAQPDTWPATRAQSRWAAYRVLGQGEVPDPAELATRLKVPQPFGERLRAHISAGTTVIVTDLPGRGGSTTPYGTLLEAELRATGRSAGH
jgi:hypothetical protein